MIRTFGDKDTEAFAGGERFGGEFGTTPEVWQNLQSQYEMDVAKNGIWTRIKDTIVPAFDKVACL